MKITRVKFKWPETSATRLRAYCAITLDDLFVVHDVKVVEGQQGLFVSMPSRKICDHCEGCGWKNPLKARFCNKCGLDMGEAKIELDERGRQMLHTDVCHPATEEFRQYIERTVLEEYTKETIHADDDSAVPPVLWARREVGRGQSTGVRLDGTGAAD